MEVTIIMTIFALFIIANLFVKKYLYKQISKERLHLIEEPEKLSENMIPPYDVLSDKGQKVFTYYKNTVISITLSSFLYWLYITLF